MTFQMPRMTAALLVAFTLSLSHQLASPRVATAQTPQNEQRDVVEVRVQLLNDIQEELRYLRTRDADRQAWEESIIRRLPSTGIEMVSQGGPGPVPVSEDENPYVDAYQKAQCICKSCSCRSYPCECPLPEAPCIDCPRISTLNPYYNVHIFGALVGDLLFNESRPVSPGAPYYLSPASPTGLDQNTVDVHGRSSYLAAALTGPQMGNFQAGGMAMVFFYNDNVLADQYGILPAQVWGDLKNEDWRFAAGLQFDVFNPGAPTMLAFSALAGSGNAGNAWRGQIRVERFLNPSEDVQWTIQGALSEPIASVIDPAFTLLSEDNGWPNLEGRIALGLGPLDAVKAKRPFEIGFSGVVGEIRSTPIAGSRVVTDVWGAGIDIRWRMTDRFGFAGEVYTGKTLGTYNGAILQNVNTVTFEGIHSTGGWGEVFYYCTPCLHTHIGYAIDDPDDGDLSADPTDFQRERNETVFGNLIWDLNQSFRIGVEATYRKTDNTSTLDNEGAGFQTQFRWSF